MTHCCVLDGKLGIPWDAGVEMPNPGRRWCRGIGEVPLGPPGLGPASPPDVRCCLGAGSSGLGSSGEAVGGEELAGIPEPLGRGCVGESELTTHLG